MSSTRWTLFASLIIGLSGAAVAGDVIVTWDPSADAAGYKVYHGTSSGAYGPPQDVGAVTQTTVNGLADCTNHYFATTAYNVAGESGFSAEVTSWPRAVISTVAPSSAVRDTQLTVTVSGVNFQSGDAVAFSNPGISVTGANVAGCNQLDLTVSVAAGASLGAADLTVTHANGVAGTATGVFTVTGDTTAPVISAVNAGNIGDTSATITWTTNEPSTSRVYYRVSGQGSYQSTGLDSTMVTAHSSTLGGLAAGTSYEYYVESADPEGNTSQSGVQSFATSDSTAPVISSVGAGNVGDTSATITWTTNEPSSSRVYYRESGQTSYQQTPLDATQVTSHSVTLSGLSTGTGYDYHVESTDAAGNTATSPDSSFTTGDSTGPQISGVQATNIDGTSATISWSTDEASTSRVYWRRNGQSSYQASDPDGTLVTAHQVDLQGLTPDTAYEYHVESTDGSGNTTTSADSGFSTGPSPFHYIAFEAEMGALTSPLRKTSGSGAFQGAWIDSPNGSGGGNAGSPLGTATFGFHAPDNGTWYLWVRLYAPNASSSGWFESVNGAIRQGIAPDTTNVWQWVPGRAYSLSAGLHTVELGGEDRRAQADRILLTDDPTFVPTAVPSADTASPSFVTNFSAQPGVGANNLSWDNPSSTDFAQTVIRYRTDGGYPLTPADGFPVTEAPAVPGSSGVYVHGNLDGGVTYYYSAFAVDAEGNVASPAQTNATQQGSQPPLPPTNLQISQLECLFGIVACFDDLWSEALDLPRVALLRRPSGHGSDLATPPA